MKTLLNLKKIEKQLKELVKPKQIKYIKTSENKMIVIEPDLKGTLKQMDLIFCGVENEEEFNLEALQNKYPGFEIVDYTNEFTEIENNIKEIFE